MRMRQRARQAAWLVLGFVIGTVLFAFCASCTPPRSHPFYLTKPFRDQGITVHLDERTSFWLDAYMLNARRRFQEDGVCLHVERAVADTEFWVDSLEGAVRTGRTPPTWADVSFICPPETAPFHWHVVEDPGSRQFLTGHFGHDTTDSILIHRCEMSDPDKSRFAARYAFVGMQCGMGRDSIVFQRVRNR